MAEIFQQIPQMVIDDLETTKIMSHELRLKLLEALSRQPTTVKQLAELVDVPQSKLYYHVGLLEKHGIITVVDTQIVSGIVEKWYQSTAQSYRIDRNLFRVQSEEDNAYGLLIAVFDSTIAEIRRAVDAGLINLDVDASGKAPLVLSKSSTLLTPEEADLIQAQLEQLHAQFTESNRRSDIKGKREYSLLSGFYPRQFDQRQADQDASHTSEDTTDEQ